MLAREIMTAPVLTVGLDATVQDITNILLSKRISAVPVVDQDGKLVGVVSEGDLVHRAEIGTDVRKKNWWLKLLTDSQTDAREYIKIHAKTAADLMTKPAISIAPNTPLADVAHLLDEHRIKRLPVVEDGRPVGIVSRSNILQALTLHLDHDFSAPSVSDHEIKAQLVKELTGQSWSGLHEINIVASDGTVHFWGIIENDDQRHALTLAAENIDGVTGVVDHLAINVPTRVSGYA